MSRAFMAGAASQAGDADSSRAPGLTSGLQGSVNVHRGTLLLVPQWQCISSFVFYFNISNFKYYIFFQEHIFHCSNDFDLMQIEKKTAVTAKCSFCTKMTSCHKPPFVIQWLNYIHITTLRHTTANLMVQAETRLVHGLKQNIQCIGVIY